MNTIRRRTARGLAALATGLLATLAMALPLALPANAAADVNVQTILSAWRDSPLYVQSGSPLEGKADEIRSILEDSKAKVYMALLPDGSMSTANAGQVLTQLGEGMRDKGKITVALVDGNSLFASSNELRRGVAGRLANEATSSTSDPVKGVQTFVDLVNKSASSGGKAVQPSSGGSGSGVGVLVALLVLALAGGAGIFFFTRRAKKKRLEREAAELAAVKQTAEEDVIKFGEEITALDADVKLAEQTPDMQNDWRLAIDSYDGAKAALDTTKRPDELRNVTTALEEGRYALACVKARVEGRELPERRPPCFFNPQHGPSARSVRWAPYNGAPRDVPACAADAERVERGLDPDAREVMVNGQRRPYWEAGPAYGPYAYGYYGGFGDMMGMMLMGTMLGSMMGGGWGGGWGGGYDAGYQEGVQDGGGDYGGGDGGGFDFGGGDFGGFGDF